MPWWSSPDAYCRLLKVRPSKKAKEIDHISFAVRSLETARRVYPSVIRNYLGPVTVERPEPTTPTSEVVRFTESGCEGFLHISYRMDDGADSLAELESCG